MWYIGLTLLLMLSGFKAESDEYVVVSLRSADDWDCPPVVPVYYNTDAPHIRSPFSYEVPEYIEYISVPLEGLIDKLDGMISVVKTMTVYIIFSSSSGEITWSVVYGDYKLVREGNQLSINFGEFHVVKQLTLLEWHVVRISIDDEKTGNLFVSVDKQVLHNSTMTTVKLGAPSVEIYGAGGALACLQLNSTGTTSLPSPRDSCVDSSSKAPCPAPLSPSIDDQSNKFCDVEDPTPCYTISFNGTGFTPEDSYTCHIKNLELGIYGNFIESTTTVANATFISTEQVVCSLTTSGQVILSSAEHGDISEPVTSLIFPTLCLDCLADLSCTATLSGCLINGKCLRPFTLVGPTEICLPSENAFGGSAPPELNVTLDSCGQVHRSNVSLRAVDGGFGLEPGALAALSSSISFEFFTRFLPGITENRTVAQLGPGLKVLQVPSATGDAVVFQLQFFNYLTGEEAEPISVTINLRRPSIHIYVEISLGGENTNSTRSRESGWFAFHFASGQASFFYEGQKLDVDLGDLSNQQLFTTGPFFLSNETFVCADLSTEIPELQGNGTELGAQSDCEPVVEQYEEGNAGCADQPA